MQHESYIHVLRHLFIRDEAKVFSPPISVRVHVPTFDSYEMSQIYICVAPMVHEGIVIQLPYRSVDSSDTT